MFWLKILKKIISILHSEISPRQIAAGFALGAFMGLPPSNFLNYIVVFFFVMMLKVNVGAAILGAGVFALVSFITDPLADGIGYFFLAKIDFLSPFWTWLYNIPVAPFTRFNNTVMLGSFILSAVIFVPSLIAVEKFIVYYRANLKEKVEKWKIMKIFNLSKIYSLYDNINQQ